MNAQLLDEHFSGATLDSRLHWTNPPERWRLDSARRTLILEPAANTDFWQRTHYGFSADNGHFLGLEVAGDFTVSTQLAFHPVHQYDQAGLMIRASANCWLKTSVEHELNGPPQLGVVVTNHGFSDWSLQDLPLAGRQIRLRLRLQAGDVTAEFSAAIEKDSTDDPRIASRTVPSSTTASTKVHGRDEWKPMRIAHLHSPADLPLLCGLYACSPKGAGFRAEFDFLRVEQS